MANLAVSVCVNGAVESNAGKEDLFRVHHVANHVVGGSDPLFISGPSWCMRKETIDLANKGDPFIDLKVVKVAQVSVQLV